MLDIIYGLQQALTLPSLAACFTGTALGIVFGALPGLTAAMGVALLIPLSFGMPTVEAFSMLLGMYCGAIYGGCISAILVGTPGTVAAAATVMEGPKLTAKGQSLKALEMATWGSFVGGMVSGLALITCAPPVGAGGYAVWCGGIFRFGGFCAHGCCDIFFRQHAKRADLGFCGTFHFNNRHRPRFR